MSRHGSGLRRRLGFSLWLAMRSLITAGLAIVVAVIMNQTAMPRLTAEAPTGQPGLSAGLGWLSAHRALLPWAPVPALLLGIAAIILRPLRPVLAVLAAISCVIAVALIVGALIGALAPLYQAPADLR